jgi:outer membrane murein-binding lipoprotein Lpp
MGEQKPERKVVGRTVAIALGIICIVLVGALVGIFTYYLPKLNNTISSISCQISQLNSNVTNLQSQVNNLTRIVNQTEPYIHSQLLHYPPVNISALSSVGGWILNWTPPTDIRVIRIQVWMGNPINVTWEGDTYITIGGEPSDPSNPSTYNNVTQLLVHYQFDSHAPSPIPHQLMFDLTPGFKVASGQTINVYRDFVNIEPYTVYSGDVQVIIYYENT